ncbi:MAG: SPOR domain-containing protein [Clostridia bacterium]|jgi:hypothetical protein|nr:SPOR domain-containing protein [Clostridia bacterium]
MAALFFGQVLGGYYLGYLEKGAEGLPGTAPQQTKVSAGVITKVLRLTPATYYTVLAGSFPEREAALQLGYALADQGVPAVITEETNYLVLIGFLNNKEKLTPFADSLHIEGQKAQVIERQMNAVSFKFRADDAYAAEVVAPFLGDLNVSLQKGLLLYSALDAAEGLPEPAAAKFTVLAAELEELAQSGQAVAEREESVLYKQDLSALAKRCGSWATAIRGWSGDPRRVAMLISQQQALALLEDYHRLMAKTN